MTTNNVIALLLWLYTALLLTLGRLLAIFFGEHSSLEDVVVGLEVVILVP